MRKIFIFASVFMIVLMTSLVFAESDLSGELEEFVKKVAEKKGIEEADIVNITEVDFNDLPNEINLGNLDEANIALYKINKKNDKPSCAITLSKKTFTKLSSPSEYYSNSFLYFGSSKEIEKSGFLETATGVETSKERGYVMLREGSITGISTNLEVLKSVSEGEIQIVIYKNGEEIGFGNVLNAQTSGVEKDYDIQSREIVTFKPGDIISVYTKSENNVKFKNVITMVEISFKNN